MLHARISRQKERDVRMRLVPSARYLLFKAVDAQPVMEIRTDRAVLLVADSTIAQVKPFIR